MRLIRLRKALIGTLTMGLAIGVVIFFPAQDAHADQVILDDLIVEGSVCLGLDCVNGESFDFDVLRIKENALRIHFQDTSSSGSYPTNDWRIVVNDSADGGDDYFAIEDLDGAGQVFRVDAGAPASALYVDSVQGNVGLGTDSPLQALDIRRTSAPRVSLQDTTTSATWVLGHALDGSGDPTGNFVIDNGDCTIFGGTGSCLILTDSGDLQIDGSLAQGSSRATKEGIEPVDAQDVLDKVTALPIAAWRYRDDTSRAQHLGPMAEDFYEAFELGSDDRHLSPGDTAGVALAAIQALTRQIERLRIERDAMAMRLQSFEARLQAIDDRVNTEAEARWIAAREHALRDLDGPIDETSPVFASAAGTGSLVE